MRQSALFPWNIMSHSFFGITHAMSHLKAMVLPGHQVCPSSNPRKGRHQGTAELHVNKMQGAKLNSMCTFCPQQYAETWTVTVSFAHRFFQLCPLMFYMLPLMLFATFFCLSWQFPPFVSSIRAVFAKSIVLVKDTSLCGWGMRITSVSIWNVETPTPLPVFSHSIFAMKLRRERKICQILPVLVQPVCCMLFQANRCGVCSAWQQIRYHEWNHGMWNCVGSYQE